MPVKEQNELVELEKQPQMPFQTGISYDDINGLSGEASDRL